MRSRHIIPPWFPVAGFLVLCALAPAPAQDWPRFRGPNGAGLSEEPGIPVQWDDGAYDWKGKLPGQGHSQPVVWGDRLFVTSAESDGKTRVVLCLRTASGAVEWTRRYDASTHPKHRRNSFASSTPCVDKERLYVSFATPDSRVVRALDHAGGEAWSRDLGPFTSQHGDGASPIVEGDLLIISNEQDGESSIVALHSPTGELRWKAPRRTEEAAYGTPMIYAGTDGRASILLSSHAHGLSSIDLLTGKANWEARVFDKRTVSSPVIAGRLALGTCGSGGGGSFLVAVRLDAKDSAAQDRVAYKLTRSMPYVPTPLVKGDLVFLWSDGGVVSCVEAATGAIVWQERVGGEYSGSPVCVEDRIYAISDEGEVVVLRAAREHRVLGRTKLGEPSRSTPAVARGRMYLRTLSHIFAVGGNRTTAGKGETQASR